MLWISSDPHWLTETLHFCSLVQGTRFFWMVFCLASGWVCQGDLLAFCLSHQRGPGFGISRPCSRKWEESTPSKVIFPCSHLPHPSCQPEKFPKWNCWEIKSVTSQETSVGEWGPVNSFAGGWSKSDQGVAYFSILWIKHPLLIPQDLLLLTQKS